MTELADNGASCDRCHVDATNNDYDRKPAGPDGWAAAPNVATNGRESICTDCHTGSIPVMHHEKNGTVAFIPSDECASLCHNDTNEAADHGDLVTGMARDFKDNGVDINDCSSCHTAWAPQCIGCHNEFDRNAEGYDLLENKFVKGEWVEYVGQFMADLPTLGVRG